MAGYSGTPLTQKLGITAMSRVVIVNAPEHLQAELVSPIHRGQVDIVVIFATKAVDLDRRFHRAAQELAAHGAIWCAWPKKASKVPTDITENLLRELFLPTGMVDNKVCAIDETWSGLRFVVRKELRRTWQT